MLGRVLGGNTKGAVIGGVVGAAGGAVVASQTASRDVVVKAKTPVTFVLTRAISGTVDGKGGKDGKDGEKRITETSPHFRLGE